MIQDTMYYKISNKIVAVVYFLGFTENILLHGIKGSFIWLFSVSSLILVLFPIYLLKVVGAGDVKLISAIIGFLGYFYGIRFLLVTFILAAIQSIFHLLYYKILFVRLQCLVMYIQRIKKEKKWFCYYDRKRDGHSATIHMSYSIFLAFLVVIILYYKV